VRIKNPARNPARSFRKIIFYSTRAITAGAMVRMPNFLK
jgi:hypothetical protein